MVAFRLLLLGLALFCTEVQGQDFPRVSPFSAVRWSDDLPEVKLEDQWYGLVSIDGLEIAEILEHSRSKYADRWQRRLEEDLVELLASMGHEPGKTVDLELTDLDSGKQLRRTGVEMTRANREAVRRAAVDRDPRRAAMERQIKEDLSRGPPESMTGAQALQDVEVLVRALRERFAYLQTEGVDLDAALAELRATLDFDQVATADFAVDLMMFLALFGDGHTRLDKGSGFLPAGFLPFLLSDSGGRAVAYRSDRSGLLSSDHPYLVGLDGVPLKRWLGVTELITERASSQYIRFRTLRNLRFVHWAREQLGLPDQGTLRVELEGEKGKSHEVVELEVSRRYPTYGAWPRSKSRKLDGNIGYLRIPHMDDEEDFLAGLVRNMEELQDTQGLIIDVRANTGGSRDALRILLPYFMKPSDKPRVVNVAAYRLRPGDDAHRREGYLGNRALFPVSSRQLRAPDRDAIKSFVRRFRPDWKLPREQFSDWHYMTVSNDGGTSKTEKPVKTYKKKVVILMDTVCFSATDVFLGAFKGWRNVTLMGTPSGGGSGRADVINLPNSRLRVLASTMVSFAPNGDLYNRSGIQPDVLMHAEPTYFTGETDEVLEAARARLARGK